MATLQAEEAGMRRNRIKTQESEIAALKKQLAGQRQDPFGGRTGGKTTHGVPSEYLCPITQVTCNLLQRSAALHVDFIALCDGFSRHFNNSMRFASMVVLCLN